MKLDESIKNFNISDYTDFRVYLRDVYTCLKRFRKPYSYESFNEELGLGKCNAIYLIIKGKRPLSEKNAKKIAACLGMKKESRKYFLELVRYQGGGSEATKHESFKKLLSIKADLSSQSLDKKYLEFFSEWYHAAILELLKTKDSRTDEKWIASKLKRKLALKNIVESIELLKKLNLIIYDYDLDKYIPSNKNIATGDEIRGHIFKSYHNQMINQSLHSLSEDEDTERDFGAVTVSVSEKHLKELKRLNAEFQKKVLELEKISPEEAEKVYQVNVQIFSLTR